MNALGKIVFTSLLWEYNNQLNLVQVSYAWPNDLKARKDKSILQERVAKAEKEVVPWRKHRYNRYERHIAPPTFGFYTKWLLPRSEICWTEIG